MIQQQIHLIESVRRAVNKLVPQGTTHEFLENKIDMLVLNPLLLVVPKSIGLHGNVIEAFTSKEITDSNLV